MADKYARFADLAAHEKEGVDYRICVADRASPVAIVAPHGGEIEPGTSQIAASIAANNFSLYCFEGLVPGRPHGDLHIKSTMFDEPEGCRVVGASEIVIAVHGREDDNDKQTVWLGGLDENIFKAIGNALERVGFKVRPTGHRLPGEEPTNICNRGRRTAGVQLELPRTLRDKLVVDTSLKQAFSAAVRAAIELSVTDARSD